MLRPKASSSLAKSDNTRLSLAGQYLQPSPLCSIGKPDIRGTWWRGQAIGPCQPQIQRGVNARCQGQATTRVSASQAEFLHASSLNKTEILSYFISHIKDQVWSVQFFCCHLGWCVHILDFKHSLQILNFLSRIVKKVWTLSTSWFFCYWSRDFLPTCLVLTSAEWMLKWENIREIFALRDKTGRGQQR